VSEREKTAKAKTNTWFVAGGPDSHVCHPGANVSSRYPLNTD